MKKIFTTIFILVAFTIHSFAQFEQELPPMQRLCTVDFSIKQSTVPLTGGYINIEVTHDRTCKPLIQILVDGSFASAEHIGGSIKPGLTVIEYKVYIMASQAERDVAINVSGGDNVNLGQYIRQTGTGTGGGTGGEGDIPCSYDAFLLVDGNPVKIVSNERVPSVGPIGPFDPAGPPLISVPVDPLFLQKIPLDGATITVTVEPTSGCDFSNPVISSSTIIALEYSVSGKSYYITIPAASSARFLDIAITISGVRKDHCKID